MPAGLEPLDPELDGAAQRAGCQAPWYYDYAAMYSDGWRPPCAQVETAPSNVTFRIANLAAGAHEFTLLAVAATPGERCASCP
jgi:Bacterial Alpha-2-macroglobulin MG10 domain